VNATLPVGLAPVTDAVKLMTLPTVAGDAEVVSVVVLPGRLDAEAKWCTVCKAGSNA
jgi:hypothetical protein